jgi:type VI secretion system secreted protein VgrG
MALIASEARFLFNISGAGFELRVIEFTVLERMSFCFEVELSLASEDEIEFDDAIGKEGLLTILGEETDRYFQGIVNQFRQTGRIGDFYLYEATMVPPLWLLSLEHDCRIHQNKSAGESNTVVDIVSQILTEGGIASDRFAFRLQHTEQYKPREFCVQYRETDLNFISRLLENEGIFYFFEHTSDQLLLVFGDSTVNYQPIEGEAEISFNPASGMVTDEAFVYEFSLFKQFYTGKVSLRDFSFVKPSLTILGQKQNKSFQSLEFYDYDGRHPDTKDSEQEDIDREAQIRLEEETVFKERAEGHSTCHGFTPGYTFTLTDHEKDSFNQEYLVLEVLHRGSQPQVLEALARSDTGTQYSNQFMAIPSSVIFRPDRKTRRPVVEGLQTAMVVGPTGEEIYTDEDGYGRIKVKFHWDRRELDSEEKRSCWLRVGQFWAGGGWGSVFIPRVGDEVLVHFLEGDPDQPIVIGSVYNEANKPLYTLPDEKTKSTIKTKSYPNDPGFNEIRFEDKKGKEEIFVHAEKDQNEVVKNNLTTTVGVDRTATIKKGDDKITVEKGDRIIEVKQGDHKLTVGKGDRTVNVDTGESSLIVNKSIFVESKTAKIFIEAAEQITLEVGASELVMKKDGSISIEGKNIAIEGSESVSISGGSVTSEAQKDHNIGGVTVRSEAKGPNVIKGGMVMLNP